MQVDIQTALAVDVARTAELAAMHNVHSTTLLGHSMGGGTVFQYAQYGDKLPMQPASVIGMAPYFKGMKLSDVNEYVKLHWLKIRDGNLETLGNIMKDVPTLLIQGSNDLITHEKDTQRVFEGLTRDEKEAITGMATIEHGWHIGFEDRLAVDLGDFLSLPTALGIDLFFFIVDFLLYREDALNLNTNEQLQTTKVLLDQWLSTVGEPASEVVEGMENQETESKVIFQWADVE